MIQSGGFGGLETIDSWRPRTHGFSKMIVGSFVYLNETLSSPPPSENKLYLSLEANEECPLKCLHCMYSRELTAKPLERSEIISWLQGGSKDHVPIVWTSINGKEPLATTELVRDIAETTQGYSDKQIIMTNALLLSSEIADQISPFINYADISLDGPPEVHDSVRGPGAFDRTWKNLKYAFYNGSFEKIGIITTLHIRNYDCLSRFLDLIKAELDPPRNRLEVTVNLYVGWPDDPMRLNQDQVFELLRVLERHPLKTRFPIPASYTHMTANIFKEFGLRLENLMYDEATGIPSVDFNGHKIVLFNHVAHNSCMLRVSVDGLIYFGCVHLMMPGKVDRFAIGTVRQDSLAEVANRVFSGEAFPNSLFAWETGCESRECYEYCLGGDRLGGYYLGGEARDPYCPILNFKL